MPTTPSRPRWRHALLPVLAVLGVGCVTSQGGASAKLDPRIAASPQYSAAQGRFVNPPNPGQRAPVIKTSPWVRFFFEKKPAGARPLDPIPLQAVTPASLAALSGQDNHVIRLGHSSHLLKLRGRYWLIDPVFSERASPVQWAGPQRFHPSPLALADVPPIDGVLISHDHFDHLDEGTVTALRGKVQRFFVPLGAGARLREMGVAPERIEEFDWWQGSEVNGVRVTATPASHFSGRSLWDRDQKTLWASWVVESGPHKLFYSGDTGYFPGFKEIGERHGPFDLALIENGAYDEAWPQVHMSPEETVRAFQDVRGRLLYLVHNSTFDLAFHAWQDPLNRVTELAAQQKLPLATPQIGEALTVGQPRENRLWWVGLR